jgi:hypothetical protein
MVSITAGLPPGIPVETLDTDTPSTLLQAADQLKLDHVSDWDTLAHL